MINLFGKSVIYDYKMLQTQYENLIAFEYAEKYLYGRVNKDYVPIEINIPNVSLKTLSPTTDPNRTVQAISFVADAFKDLSHQFDKKAATGQIDAGDQYLSKLEVAKAYESPKVLYNRHLQIVKKTISSHIRKNNITFSNFDQFIMEVTPILKKISKNVPVTYSGFIKSKYCPMNVSGLVIEIADLDSSNDEQKIRRFRNSKNWEFYLNACRSYGFSVDVNNPWRLVADIGSDEMLKYARKYGYTNTDAVLKGAYIGSHKSFMATFRNILLEIYNSSKKVFSEIQCVKGVFAKSNIIIPVEYSTTNLNSLISNAQLVDLYSTIRFVEDETIFYENDIHDVKRHLQQLTILRGASAAIREIEILIAPTFNESGSLTDLIYRDKLRK